MSELPQKAFTKMAVVGKVIRSTAAPAPVQQQGKQQDLSMPSFLDMFPAGLFVFLISGYFAFPRNVWQCATAPYFCKDVNKDLVWLKGVLFCAIFCYFGVVGHTKDGRFC